jgi:hypothetical protein
MKKICLIGCGNVGSRHLQAISRLSFPVEIDVVEPSFESQKLGKKRLDEIEYDKNFHKVSWFKEIQELENKYELTIVATTATGRANLLCELADLGHLRFLIEKMVCQSDEEYEEILKKFHKKNIKGWVNTNPRCFSSYQKLKKYFDNSEKIHFSVTASNVSALGTNTIHYVDLFTYFLDNYNIELNGEFLLNEIFSNKRGSHLIEFGGTVVGKSKNGSTITLSFLPSDKIPTIVNIVGNNNHFLIDESNEEILDLVNKEKLDFTYEHASSITTKITKEILENDSCGLSTIENSQILHKEIFKMFNAHVKKVTDKQMELCPIT